jgi:DNA helicase-4
MNIKGPKIEPFEDDHIEKCKQVLKGEVPISGVVEDLRAAVKGEERTSQTEVVIGIAKRERTVFKKLAAQAIDRHLPATEEGTAASALKINKGLLNFVSLVTPNIRLRARAGSGKSTALVIKCDFLINKLAVPPEAIQLLVFNKSASEDLRKKLCAALGDVIGKKVGVNTFHSIAYHVLKCSPKTKHLTLAFREEDRSQKETLSDLEETVIKETASRDFGHYRERYEGTSDAYMARNDDFNKSIQDFVTVATALYRARRGTPKPIKHNLITRHLERVVAAYETRMEKSNTLDGEAGLRKAARILASDTELPGLDLDGGLQFLFVDEFQDFSAAFSEITKGVMSRNPSCVMNAVGDDWQSINAFMGADLSFFNGMKKAYDATLNLPLQSNWRCGKRIVDLGNKVMGATPTTAAVPALPHEGKIRVRVGGIQNYRRKTDEWHAEAQEYLERQINRMAQAAWDDDARAGREPGTVVLLATLNKPFSKSLSAYAKMIDNSSGGQVSWSTSHASKGSEWDHVILLDGTASHYPSDHPSEPTKRDMITRAELEEEGRRLLYVAVTRAKQSLAILVPTELHPKLQYAQHLAQL